MGAYLDTPVTAKQSSHSVCRVGEREVVYASTAMQGWRVSMEDAHTFVPDFDKDTALLGVFDGHGGKEVAEYCSRHMPEMLQSNSSYQSGDLQSALKEVFLLADRKLLEKDVIKELKRYVAGVKDNETDIEMDSSEEREEANKLIEEANMPLETLLARYVADGHEKGGGVKEEEEGTQDEDSRTEVDGHVRSMLQALANEAGFEIEFEDTSDSEDSEYETEDVEGEGKEEGEEQAGKKGEGDDEGEGKEGGGREEQVERKEGDGTSSCNSLVADEDRGTLPSSASNTMLLPQNNTCLHNNIDDTPTSSTQPSCEEVVEKQVNGRTEIESVDSGPVNSATYGTHVSSASSGSDCTPTGNGRCTSGNDRSSKSHLLLDLLTSTVTSQTTSIVDTAVGAHESRKRCREDTDLITDGSEPSKRPCRGVLDEEGYHSGTTAVLCLLRENSLTVANAGDSRCVISCKGKAVDMSEDHKPTDEAEISRIERAGGCVGADGRVNGGLNLSRAIGDHFYKENASLPLEEQMITAVPDVEYRELQEGDEFIIVACDGIWNTKSSQEVVDFVLSRLSERHDGVHSVGGMLENICESLCDACLAPDTDNDGTGCDNMTVTILLLQSSSSLLPPSPAHNSS